MTAPERIWLQDGGDFDAASEVTWCQHSIDDADTEYVRADLAAVQPAQVKPDCCDICRGGTFAETSDGKGWRCVECKAVWLSHTLEPQPDPRDEVIKGLVEALRNIAEGNLGDAAWQANYARIKDVASTALAAAKAVQHG